MTKPITDQAVEQHISLLRRLSGSTDLKEMIRADLRYCDNAYDWHRRTRKLLARLGIWYVTAAAGVSSGLCLHYWITNTYGPMAAGVLIVAGLPIALCGFIWLCSH